MARLLSLRSFIIGGTMAHGTKVKRSEATLALAAAIEKLAAAINGYTSVIAAQPKTTKEE